MVFRRLIRDGQALVHGGVVGRVGGGRIATGAAVAGGVPFGFFVGMHCRRLVDLGGVRVDSSVTPRGRESIRRGPAGVSFRFRSRFN